MGCEAAAASMSCLDLALCREKGEKGVKYRFGVLVKPLGSFLLVEHLGPSEVF